MPSLKHILYNYQFTMKELKIKQISDGLSYSRESILGKGAFGQVYLGFDDTRKAPCAFKIVNLQKLSQQVNAQSLLKKIKDEIVNMQLIKNDNVIEFYQAKKSTNNIYIVCEYCNGTSLAKYIENKQYLTENQALNFFKEILKGFKHLHQNKIVHRDLKPANLMLHNYSIKIGDLGFSKVTENHEQMLQSIVGTPLYMSPQIFDRQGYTQKTDIWSLGAILFEMLYGRNPWVGCKNLYELKQRIRSEIAFPKYPRVSNKVKQTIRKMLRLQQYDRINWQGLFSEYLEESPIQNEQPLNNGYFVSNSIKQYFKLCFNMESYLQLPKLAKQLNLISEGQLQKHIGVYHKAQQFYTQYLFITKNEQLVNEFYDFYLEKHNEISYLIVLSQKLSELAQNCYLQLSALGYCLILLIYRYNLSILEELYKLDRLAMPDRKYQPIYGKFFHQKILLALFKSTYQVLLQQYQRFMPFFEQVISQIKNHSVYSIIQKDLSGIFSSNDNEKRVLKFFTTNYLKKTYNILKNTVKAPSSMVNEQDEAEQNELPSKEITLIKMIQEYLNNNSLFVVTRQSSDKKKNMAQLLYEWQTSINQQFFQTLQKTPFMKEQSINSFLKKQIVWKPVFLQQFV